MKFISVVCGIVLMSAASVEVRLQGQAAAAPAKNAPITVTGCVAAGAKAGKFVLNNGMRAGEKTGKSYDLVGGTLKAHVGHKVALTGTLQPAAMAKDHKMSKEDMAAMPGVLRVKTMKMIAATCS